ncbi:MAG: hypothetical protein JXA33_11750 [Anaerolineae bacterium]|nr:hypothetical protein [Anaerolineae bacterium]
MLTRHVNKRVVINWTFVITFFVAMSIPGLSYVFGIEDMPSSEKRSLLSAPQLQSFGDALIYPMTFEKYFNDNFPQRNRLVHTYFISMAGVLGNSGSPDVLLGKDGWLFYSKEQVIDNYQNLVPLTEAQLSYMQQNLTKIKESLDARGVAFLVVIPPNKVSIYPEFLPDTVHNETNSSKLDQIVAYFQSHSAVQILDLRAPLRAAKSEYLVYHPTDTHWTGYGAYIAYREVIQHLQPGFQNMIPYGWDEVTITQMEAPGGDLAGMLTLQDNVTEHHIVIGPPKAVQYASVSSTESTPEYTVFVVDNADLPRALVFYDSFFPSLQLLFAEHFSWSLYRTWQTDYDLIYQDVTNMTTEFEPNVVVLEIVERWIYQLIDSVLLEE